MYIPAVNLGEFSEADAALIVEALQKQIQQLRQELRLFNSGTPLYYSNQSKIEELSRLIDKINEARE